MKQIEEKKRQRWLNLVILASVCVIIFCLWNVFSIENQYQKAQKEYDDLRAEYVTPKTDTAEGGEDTAQDTPGIQVNLEGLKKENPDVIGWLYYEGTAISYPVLQDDDNKYYIDHTYKGEKNSAGSIFLDAWNDGDFKDRNTFIYGHNMRNGTMFGSLKNVRNEDTVKKYPFFWIFTEEGWNKYEIFSHHEAETADRSFTIHFQKKSEYASFLNDLKEKSEKKIDVKTDAADRIVTLSTCTSDGSVRFLVHGVLR